LIKMVARGGIEPPTRGFSLTPGSPRRNYGTPSLRSSQSRHTRQIEMKVSSEFTATLDEWLDREFSNSHDSRF
jgi:hypothetical protein